MKLYERRIEKTERRKEFALNVLPRASEIFLRLIGKDKWPWIWAILRSDYFSMMAFQIAIATWMVAMNTDQGRSNIMGRDIH